MVVSEILQALKCLLFQFMVNKKQNSGKDFMLKSTLAPLHEIVKKLLGFMLLFLR